VRTVGDETDLANLRQLRAHWATLGRNVPLFAVSAEPVDAIVHWAPDRRLDLVNRPYELRILED